MLLILIPIAWLSIATLLVAVCQMAARADAELAAVVGSPREGIRQRFASTAHATRVHQTHQLAPRLSSRHPAFRRRRAPTRGGRPWTFPRGPFNAG